MTRSLDKEEPTLQVVARVPGIRRELDLEKVVHTAGATQESRSLTEEFRAGQKAWVPLLGRFPSFSLGCAESGALKSGLEGHKGPVGWEFPLWRRLAKSSWIHHQSFAFSPDQLNDADLIETRSLHCFERGQGARRHISAFPGARHVEWTEVKSPDYLPNAHLTGGVQ